MQLHYLLVVIVVSDVSDVEVMSSTVAVIFAITWVVNNCNIRTEPSFFKRTEPNSFRTESDFFKKNRIRTEIKKSILHIPDYERVFVCVCAEAVVPACCYSVTTVHCCFTWTVLVLHWRHSLQADGCVLTTSNMLWLVSVSALNVLSSNW